MDLEKGLEAGQEKEHSMSRGMEIGF